MKGSVLQVPNGESAGFISGDDNKRYLFDSADIRSGSVKAGDRVDFDGNEDRAREIFIIESSRNSQLVSRRYVNKPPLNQLWFTFSGRAPRYDYWVRGMLPCILLMVPAAIIDGAIFGFESQEGLFAPLVFLLAAWVSIVLSVKRLRDMDKSPWFALLYMVPIANLIIGIMVSFVPGTVGKNQYGEDPLSAER